MTIAQIAAIISLLIAFNVPQPTVDNVQTILENANTPSKAIGIPTMVAPEQTKEEKIENLRAQIDSLYYDRYELVQNDRSNPHIQELTEEITKLQKQVQALQHND